MKEQEYIDTTDLCRVRLILDILRDITPSISSGINSISMDIVYDEVSNWERRLSNVIKIK